MFSRETSIPRAATCPRRRLGLWLAVAMLSGPALVDPAQAQRIENGTAVIAALDKVTARISRLEVKLNETATFGALKVTPRACYSRPPTEPPKTVTFLEVDEVMLDGKVNRIFNGWMFAESPALNPLEHPVFDIWLTECAAPLRPGVAEKSQPRPRQTQGGAPTSGGTPPTGKGQPAPPQPPPSWSPADPPDEPRRRPPR